MNWTLLSPTFSTQHGSILTSTPSIFTKIRLLSRKLCHLFNTSKNAIHTGDKNINSLSNNWISVIIGPLCAVTIYGRLMLKQDLNNRPITSFSASVAAKIDVK